MAILQLIEGRKRDLGGFVVRRVLPAPARQMVGPFIFFDHLGPVEFAAGSGIDVRPHPHIGLATVTYLFEGTIEHRDSVGSQREIRPGDVNWMTAGSGIVHSERTPQAARAAVHRAHGIQSWVALPDGHEEGAPSFNHHPAATLPKLVVAGGLLTVIAGEAYGARAPVFTSWPTLYVHAQLSAGSRVEVPPRHEERAVYVVDGYVMVGNERVETGQMAVLAPGTHVTVDAVIGARLMLLGGQRFLTPRYLFWNFVASSPDRIEAAKERWERQEFAQVPGETDFIPLPTT